MSSAAVQQNTPQQYNPTSSGRDHYASAAANVSSSPLTSRRTGRSTAGDNGSLPNTPQTQTLHTPPPGSATMTTPRGPVSPTEPMSASDYQQFYPGNFSDNSLPTNSLPIRTSSQQRGQPSPTFASDNRSHSSSRTPQHQGLGQGIESERDHVNDNDRRRQYQSPRGDSSQPGSGRSQRTRNAPVASRSATAIGQPPVDTSLPRENSAIINHIVVDDPQSDIARERARVAEARPHQAGTVSMDVTAMAGLNTTEDHNVPESERAAPVQRSRQEHLKQPSSHRKEVKFGDYILGQTLGEGEFGKVKMGWKKDSAVQVAIKLIRKESLAGNTTRLPKIYREISILRKLQHPNIVRLHEFVETERHMGIILEYASGGELFDYILNHRYLKDPAARRLFAQLVSGVGYLHKKGIVHRDLKLENLLLDRNRNIIITDFGFANTFSPSDELGDEIERRITEKDFVKAQGLDVVGADGHRRGDLMQTSCGSPCYAAPELVVSDGLYTGRKVDVWSCGVILYAMLAGYLPFDDDPANPEGDNINLLYKYIVSTPLTFPEYVTPHARDLLRQVLVPEPRRRADLFEVARHSWLSEYTHVVGFIGSSSKNDKEIASSAMQPDLEPVLGRSASVREPTSRSPATVAPGIIQKQPALIGDDANDTRSQQRDNKRRTVQVEYVAPKAATARGETSPPPATQNAATASPYGRTKARVENQGPVEVTAMPVQEPQVPKKEGNSSSMPPPARSTRGQMRNVSDSTTFSNQPTSSASRPTTGGTLGGGARLPSRGNSYSQPSAATPTTTNVQGHFSQPKPNTGYIISSPMPVDQGPDTSRPVSQQNLPQFRNSHQSQQPLQRTHKRSSTLGSIGDRLLGRSNSRRKSQQTQDQAPGTSEKRDRKYPPVSMMNVVPNNHDDPQPRASSESRRPSFGFNRKNSDAPSERRSSRRFSFLPSNFSIGSFSGKKDQPFDSAGHEGYQDSYARTGRPPSKGMAFGRGQSPSPSQSTTNSTIPMHYDANREAAREKRRSGVPQGMPQSTPDGLPQSRGNPRYEKALPPQPGQQDLPTPPIQRKQFRDDGYGGNALDTAGGQDSPERYYTPHEEEAPQSVLPRSDLYSAGGTRQQQYQGYANDGYDQHDSQAESSGYGNPQLRPQQRKFGDAYDQGYAGSSSGARRVMDFFRRRGKDRSQA